MEGLALIRQGIECLRAELADPTDEELVAAVPATPATTNPHQPTTPGEDRESEIPGRGVNVVARPA
jgi:hypothetical protein